MCGGFTQHYTWAEVHAALDVFGAPRNLRPRYNIAPTTQVDVVRLDAQGRRELVAMRWGLIPVWWKKAAKACPRPSTPGPRRWRPSRCPQRVQTPPLHRPRLGHLRVDGRQG